MDNKSLKSADELKKELNEFLNTLNTESARGKVLIACSYIDVLLERMLKSIMINDFTPTSLFEGMAAPLGTLSAKIAMGKALGLITSAEVEEIVLLKKVRNDFAHEVHKNFNDINIKSICQKLKYSGEEEVNPASQFAQSAVSIITALFYRPIVISRGKLFQINWETENLAPQKMRKWPPPEDYKGEMLVFGKAKS